MHLPPGAPFARIRAEALLGDRGEGLLRRVVERLLLPLEDVDEQRDRGGIAEQRQEPRGVAPSVGRPRREAGMEVGQDLSKRGEISIAAEDVDRGGRDLLLFVV